MLLRILGRVNRVAFRRINILALSLLLAIILATAFTCFVMKNEMYRRSVSTPQLSLEANEIDFPYHIPDTALVVEAFVSYEGEYLEDCSFDMVFNVAALVVRNMGNRAILLSDIYIFGEFGEYNFLLNNLPAHESAMIVEKSRKNFTIEKFSSIEASVSYTEDDWKSDYLVTNYNETTIAVKNISKERKPMACIYYKTRYPDADLYMHGNAFSAFISALNPGETVYIELKNYSHTYSKIVMIESK